MKHEIAGSAFGFCAKAKCKPGEHQDMPAQANCEKRPKGMACDDVGQRLCKDCPSGKYSPETEPEKYTCNPRPQGKRQGAAAVHS